MRGTNQDFVRVEIPGKRPEIRHVGDRARSPLAICIVIAKGNVGRQSERASKYKLTLPGIDSLAGDVPVQLSDPENRIIPLRGDRFDGNRALVAHVESHAGPVILRAQRHRGAQQDESRQREDSAPAHIAIL